MIVEPLEWVREQGIVLQSARGPVPNLAEYVAGEPIRGSWWGHASGHEIFAVLSRVLNSPDVIATRLVNGKVTLIHRRLWPALVRVADRFPKERLAAVDEEHTASGAHRTIEIPFPDGSLPEKSPARGTHCRRRAHPTASLPPLTRQVGQACDGRSWPPPLRPTHARLRRAPHSRRPVEARDHPLLESATPPARSSTRYTRCRREPFHAPTCQTIGASTRLRAAAECRTGTSTDGLGGWSFVGRRQVGGSDAKITAACRRPYRSGSDHGQHKHPTSAGLRQPPDRTRPTRHSLRTSWPRTCDQRGFPIAKDRHQLGQHIAGVGHGERS